LNGTQKPIAFESEMDCQDCGGTGAAAGSQPEVCSDCGGRGQVVRSQGFFSMATTCGTCRGTGTIIKNPCKKCRGRGRVSEQRKILVTVPPGVDNGTQLRMVGEGEAGARGTTPGDLYVELRVKPDRRFEREGIHLFGEVEVSYLQALLGGELEVETLRGKKILNIPRGCQFGQELKLAGEGLPELRSARVGDLIFAARVVIPKKLSKEEEKLLRQIADGKSESKAGGREKPGFWG